jgi:hypothetical protein
MQTVELICILPLKGQGRMHIHYLASEIFFFFRLSYEVTYKSVRSIVTYCVFSPVFSLFLCFCWESWEPDCVPLFRENRCMDVTSQRPLFCAHGFVLSRGVFGCPITLHRISHYGTLAVIHENVLPLYSQPQLWQLRNYCRSEYCEIRMGLLSGRRT